MINLPTPINIFYWWNFGSILGLYLFIQILRGLFLSIHYCPNVSIAFDRIIHIVQNVSNGWIIHNVHINDASGGFSINNSTINRFFAPGREEREANRPPSSRTRDKTGGRAAETALPSSGMETSSGEEMPPAWRPPLKGVSKRLDIRGAIVERVVGLARPGPNPARDRDRTALHLGRRDPPRGGAGTMPPPPGVRAKAPLITPTGNVGGGVHGTEAAPGIGDLERIIKGVLSRLLWRRGLLDLEEVPAREDEGGGRAPEVPIIESTSMSNLSKVNITSPIVPNEMDFDDEVQPISEVSTDYSCKLNINYVEIEIRILIIKENKYYFYDKYFIFLVSKENISPPRKRLFAKPRYISEINTSDVSTPKRTRRVISFIKQMDQKKSKQIKDLQDENRRLRKRIVTLQELVSHLKESTLISEDVGDHLMVCYG
ncbi:Cytochrome b [Trachymyrmex zeteki]|uniref:Cytochrome b n=1 Tax=Mycetomoellerius zeteki TaxID=64791 RepID=A0A151XHT5_9HYME|nr:Cytochrome b [Trachymyrmex zeteki]